MDIVIRDYTKNDFSSVSRIIMDNFRDNKVEANNYEHIKEYVAVLDGEVVGYFVLTDIANVVRGFHYYLVDYVCVDINHHHMGIGKTMMKFVIEKAKDEHIKYIQLTSSNKRVNAQKMYMSLGFEKHDTNIFRLVI